LSEETSTLNFETGADDVGRRLDAFLAEKIEGWSRARLQKLIDDGDVTVNGKPSKSSYKLRGDEQIEAELTETLIEKFEPENIPLEIIYEDDSFAVINKPAGMVVHPGAGVTSGTLANAIAYKFKIQNSEFKIEDGSDEQSKIQNLKSKIGIVHRLDKNTSGLIVVAKNETVHEALSEQFRRREVFKSYLALCHGKFDRPSGTIDEAISRDVRQRTRMAIVKGGRKALTLWKVRRQFERFTLLEVEIKTGRTHQIRVHLAHIRHPVVGDETYNGGRDKTVPDAGIRRAIESLGRFFLHAEKLAFTHPVTKAKMNFTAPLPQELTEFLELI
jgi:23S rRNA pseudouridine1911/1915/1917 synthase